MSAPRPLPAASTRRISRDKRAVGKDPADSVQERGFFADALPRQCREQLGFQQSRGEEPDEGTQVVRDLLAAGLLQGDRYQARRIDVGRRQGLLPVGQEAFRGAGRPDGEAPACRPQPRSARLRAALRSVRCSSIRRFPVSRPGSPGGHSTDPAMGSPAAAADRPSRHDGPEHEPLES
jgi:hypothetical protein